MPRGESSPRGKTIRVSGEEVKDGSAGYPVETWAGLDGKSWVRLGSPSGAAVSNEGSNGHWSDGFDVGGRDRLVVNLMTSQTRGLVSDVFDGQKIYGSYAVVAAEWTNTVPSR